MMENFKSIQTLSNKHQSFTNFSELITLLNIANNIFSTMHHSFSQISRFKFSIQCFRKIADSDRLRETKHRERKKEESSFETDHLELSSKTFTRFFSTCCWLLDRIRHRHRLKPRKEAYAD